MSPAALALVPAFVAEPSGEPRRRALQLWFPLWWLGPKRPRRPRRSKAEMVAARAWEWEKRETRRLVKARRQRLRRRQLRFRWPRKCSALPRARSISSKRLTRLERKVADELRLVPWDAERPRVRADCEGQPRPCPWVSCRYNLYLDVADNGTTIKYNFPDLLPEDMPPTGSCVLDIADRVAEGETICLADIGKVMNLSIERVRQLSSLALQGARVKTMWEDTLVKIRLPPRGPVNR